MYGTRPTNGYSSRDQRPNFSTDAVGAGVHSFPIAGAGATTLNREQYIALKLIARHIYGYGNNSLASYGQQIELVKSKNKNVTTALDLLGPDNRQRYLAKLVANQSNLQMRNEPLQFGVVGRQLDAE